MLRTNLSTRPFYNLRAVQLVLGALGAVVVAMTLVNGFELVRLASSERTLGARATRDEAEASRLREEAGRIRARINAKELAEVAEAAQEANAIIDLRAFSWTDVFAQIETTLPENVRLTTFQPRVEKSGVFVVNLGVQARRVQELAAFLDALEKTGRFHDVLAVDEKTNVEGLIDARVEGTYTRAPAGAQPTSAPAPPQGKGAAGE